MSKSGMSSVTGISSSKHRRSSKRLSVISTTDGFKETLYEMCKELNMDAFPTVKCLLTEPLPWIFQETGSNVEVVSRQSSTTSKKQTSKQIVELYSSRHESEITQGIIEKPGEEIRVIYPNRGPAYALVCKHFKISDHILGALQKTLPKYNTIRVLKLEFCQLTVEQLKAVKYLVVANKNIVDVSLDGNYIPKQPHYIIAKGANVRYLSLRFCKINDRALLKFRKPINATIERSVLQLNLASNLITDVGAKCLAEELRTNRTLTHLNLTDNLITDVGLIELMKVLRRFPLTHDEIVLRRQKNLYRLQLKDEIRYDITKNKNKSESSVSSVSLIKSDLVSKRSCSSARMRVATAASQRRRNSADSHKSLESLIESKLPKDSYPYVYDCTAEDKQIYCRGNSCLQYLNLSYNKITDDGLDFVKDTLREMQMQKVFADDGENRILKIVLEGNNIKHPDLISNKSSFSSSKTGSSATESSSKASSRSSVKERRLFASKIII